MPAATAAATQLPDAAALRAAALSFGKALPTPSPSSSARSSTIPLSPLTAKRTARWSSTREPSCNTPTSPTMAASIVFTRPSPSKEDNYSAEEGVTPVRLRRKLFQDGHHGNDEALEFPPPMHRMTPERNHSLSPKKGRVDSSPLDNISSLKNMFEQSTPTKSPAIHSPKANNPSLTAAVLATQLSPPSSSPTSRQVSPNRRAPASPTRRSPVHRKVPSASNPQLNPPPRTRGKPPVRRKPSALSTRPSRESLASSAMSVDIRSGTVAATIAVRPSSSALTAAIIAHASSTHSSPSQSPQTTGSQPQITSSNAPQPPPARKTKKKPSVGTPTSSNAPTKLLSPPVLPHRSNPNISTVSLPLIRANTATPPPLPARQVSPAKAAALISASAPNAALSRRSSFTSLTSLATARTGGTDASTIAASLAPSRTNTPGPRKLPTAPTPPPRRRRSLPSLPKQMLKETLRPPPKSSRSPSPSPKPPRGVLSRRGDHHHHSEALKHRWRWNITPKERRRYEGLWAANRGLLLPQEQKDLVVNIIVRDVWQRSRLGFRTLSEIWDLVDRGGKGGLDREEFCVGTWLVDMALRGRKVPVKVEESVWEGVRNLGAVLPPIVDGERKER